MTATDGDNDERLALPPESIDGLRRLMALAREQRAPVRLGRRSLQILERMLEHPEDVTLRSIGGIARQCGVSPSTLTRLAHRLGFDGFKAFQRLFRLDVARGSRFYSSQATRQLAGEEADGDARRKRETPGAAAARRELRNVAETARALDMQQIVAARDAMLGARRLYVLGLRGCYGAAHYLGYYLGFLGKPVITLGGPGVTIAEDISDIGEGDLLIAVTVRPETRLSVDCCRLASQRGATVVTVTNHYASPARAFGRYNLYARCDGPYYFNPLAALFVVIEVLLAEVAAALGEEVLEPLRHREAVFEALGVE